MGKLIIKYKDGATACLQCESKTQARKQVKGNEKIASWEYQNIPKLSPKDRLKLTFEQQRELTKINIIN
jgi:hypothetical protein